VTRALLPFLAAFFLCFGFVRAAHAESRLYVLAIGNDAPPATGTDGEQLPVLHYADDDAAAFYAFTRPLSREARLLTVLDAPSQRRFPALASSAAPPSLAELRRAIAGWKPRIQADRDAGHDPVLLLFFSGHGARTPEGDAALVFTDGLLGRAALYDEVLAEIPARYVHLVVDACYAESVVRPRDAHATTVPLSPRDVDAFGAKTTLARFPHVGALIGSSVASRTFEWDAIEHGVFTHALLSGMRGGADVNGDGRIEYSEIHAFLTAANRDVPDARARLSVVAEPPRIDRRAPLLDVTALTSGAVLTGAPARLGHFWVEDELGRRVLDFRAERDFRVRLRVPAGRLYLRNDATEATLGVEDGELVAFDSLQFFAQTTRARGAIEGAMQRGLFAAPFGPTYYRAFLDGKDDMGLVPVEAPAPDAPISAGVAPGSRFPSRTAAWTMLAVGGALAIASGACAVAAIQAKHDYDRTSLEREAADLRDRFTTLRTLAIGGAITTSVAVGVSLWLFARSVGTVTTKPSQGARASAGGLELAW
jgi:hypothetical protein